MTFYLWITALLEICFPQKTYGLDIDFSDFNYDLTTILFSENSSIVVQACESIENILKEENINYKKIGSVLKSEKISLKNNEQILKFDSYKYLVLIDLQI